jgi:cobalt-zinc-cadmium efflux system protein
MAFVNFQLDQLSIGAMPFTLPSICFCGRQHQSNQIESTRDYDRQFHLVRSALLVLLLLFLLQWFLGHWSGSLTVRADAGHLLSDIFAFSLTLGAIYLAQQPPSEDATFGHARLEVLAALLNGLSLVGIAVWMICESWQRWQNPDAVLSVPMLLAAAIGLVVNLYNVAILQQESHQSLNLQAAMRHVWADLMSSIGTLVAGISIRFWHCVWIDAVMGLGIAVMTLITVLPLLRDSLVILLEYKPSGVDSQVIRQIIQHEPAVQQIQALHIWQPSSSQVMVCAQIQVEPQLSANARDHLLRRLQIQLKQAGNVQTVVIQIVGLPQPALLPIHPAFQSRLSDLVIDRPPIDRPLVELSRSSAL